MRAVFAVALVLGVSLTACDDTTPSAAQHRGAEARHVTSGAPAKRIQPRLVAEHRRILGTFTLRTGQNGDLLLVTHGSSTCPWEPTSAKRLGNGRLQVTVDTHHPRSGLCTANDAPHVQLVPLPAGYDAMPVERAVLTTPDGARHVVRLEASSG